jgi:hypothetical protein
MGPSGHVAGVAAAELREKMQCYPQSVAAQVRQSSGQISISRTKDK